MTGSEGVNEDLFVTAASATKDEPPWSFQLPEDVWTRVLAYLPIYQVAEICVLSKLLWSAAGKVMRQVDTVVCSTKKQGKDVAMSMAAFLPIIIRYSCRSGKLQHLIFSHSYSIVDDCFLSRLQRQIRYSQSKPEDESGFSAEKGKISPLELDISWCEVSVAGLYEFAKHIPIIALNITGLSGLTPTDNSDWPLRSVFLLLRESLVELDLTWCRLRYASDVCIDKEYPNLRTLKLVGNECFGDNAVKQLAISCPELRHLDISYCAVSDIGLAWLAVKAKNLTCLTLSAKRNNVWVDGEYTHQGVALLKKMRPDIYLQIA